MPKELIEQALEETRNSKTSTRSLATNPAFLERDQRLYGGICHAHRLPEQGLLLERQSRGRYFPTKDF